MALPSIAMPPSLPDWLLAGYQVEPLPVFGRAPMSIGPGRSRRLWTVVERRQTASLALLSAAQLAAWHQFVEVTLQAGLLPFAGRFANTGPGVRWFDTLLLNYASAAGQGTLTTITAELLLRGDAYRSGPA